MSHAADDADPPLRHRTPSAEVEAALLAAARKLLDEEGPEALSVRRIAGEAGVAPMGVYNRLGGKNGIMDALFRDGFERLRDAFATLPHGTPPERLRAAGRRYREFALAHPAVYSVMFDRPVADFVPSPESHVVAAESFEELVRIVADGQAAGVITAGDAAEVAQRVWSACHGAVSLELRGIGFVVDRDADYEALLETLDRGLAARSDDPLT